MLTLRCQMKITDHIGIFEKGLPLNVCEAVIQSFNLWEGQREFIAEAFKDGENQFKDGNFSRSDTQLCLEVVDLDLYQTLNGFVKKAFEQYTSVYSGILQNNDPVSTWTTKVQKTKAGGGYHQYKKTSSHSSCILYIQQQSKSNPSLCKQI